jgi:hypothetical protein
MNLRVNIFGSQDALIFEVCVPDGAKCSTPGSSKRAPVSASIAPLMRFEKCVRPSTMRSFPGESVHSRCLLLPLPNYLRQRPTASPGNSRA